MRITGITIYMLIRSPFLGGCALAIVPVVAVVNKFYGDWLGKNAVQVQSALAEANSVCQEAFACARTVVAFAAEEHEHDKYVARINRHYDLNIQQLFMTGVYYMAVSTFLINTCVQAALLYIGSILIHEGRISSEVLLAFMLYQGQLQVRERGTTNLSTRGLVVLCLFGCRIEHWRWFTICSSHNSPFLDHVVRFSLSLSHTHTHTHTNTFTIQWVNPE